MRIVKVFLALVVAVFFGFVIHFNWDWLNRRESVVFFAYETTAPLAESVDGGVVSDVAPAEAAEVAVQRRFQTVPIPVWGYFIGAMAVGAIFIVIGSLREIYLTRRERRALARERKDLAERYGHLRGPDDQDVAYNVGDSGREELRP